MNGWATPWLSPAASRTIPSRPLIGAEAGYEIGAESVTKRLTTN